MQSGAKKLPEDVETLQSLLLAAFEQNEALREENWRFHARVETLQEQLNLALARRYAASSGKIPADQLRLFDEAEVDAELSDAPADDTDTVEVAGYARKKRGRRPPAASRYLAPPGSGA